MKSVGGGWCCVLDSGMRSQEVSQLFHQFAAMLQAGVAIDRACASILETARGPMREVVQGIRDRIAAGGSGADGFRAFPEVFTVAELAVIDAGERSGRLDVMLTKLGDARDAAIAMRRKMQTRLMYPCILLMVLMGLSVLLSLIGPDGGVVAALRTLLAWGIGVTGIGLLLKILFFSRRSGSDWQLAIDTVVSAIPVVGGAVSALACARFLRTMEALYLAGIDHGRAFVIASEAAGNLALSQRLAPAGPLLKEGAELSKSLSATSVFSTSSMQLLATGETSGSLDAMLDRAAQEYEARAATAMTGLSILVPVLVYIGVAILVAIKVVGFYVGYFGTISEALEF